jgi:L-arabinokinase
MQVAYYISGHGFGHATRSIEVIRTLAARRPDARFLVRTSAPRWLFERSAVPIDVEFCEPDVGVQQKDALSPDEEATARRAAAFYRDFDRRVDDEAARLRRAGAEIVLADVPPLAFAAANRAGLPSVAVANFTWDWIYTAYDSFAQLAPEVIPMIRRAYATCTRALRLPFHGGFEPMAGVTLDIPLVARRATCDPRDTRRALGVAETARLVLASFGGYAVTQPSARQPHGRPFTLISVDERPITGPAHHDLVAAADVVISKPGYGIVSECVANDTPLLYTSRGHFAEYEVFVEEMPRLLRCRHLSHDDWIAGRWSDAIDALAGQAPPPERPRLDGAAVAAGDILALIERS